MSSIEGGADSGLINSLPKTAVQALYHAVTGKTENLSKWINGNVIIRFDDISSLFGMLSEQIQHYTLISKETVTIVTTDSNDRKTTYSSWERFSALQAQANGVTSDISLKIEFVAELPNTATPQRCIINVTLDSALPVIKANREDLSSDSGIGFLLWMANDWRSVHVSIDFVDYLLAKNFVSSVEEWFKSLEKTPSSSINRLLVKYSRAISNIGSQLGRIGCAIFLLSYFFISQNTPDTRTIIMIGAIALIIWAIIIILSLHITVEVRKRSLNSIVSTSILLNKSDEKAYQSILDETNSAAWTAAKLSFGVFMAIFLNVVASYIFAYTHG